MASMPAFDTCHQCYGVGSSLVWGLNFPAAVCGIFQSSSSGVFSEYSGLLSFFIGDWFPSINKLNINVISTVSNDELHVTHSRIAS